MMADEYKDFIANIETVQLSLKDISVLELPEDIENTLRRGGCTRVQHLLTKSEKTIRKIEGIDDTVLAVIQEKLQVTGLEVGDWFIYHKSEPVKNREYPYNLYTALKEASDAFNPPAECTPDHMKGLTFAMENLTSEEQSTLVLRFKHCYTYAHIAELYGISSARAQSLTAKALRKLLRPGLREIIELGFQKHIEDQINKRYGIQFNEQMKASYKAGYHDGYEAGAAKAVCKPDFPSDKQHLMVSIETADFTVRTYNALRRSGVATIYDLLQFSSVSEVTSIKNLGLMSYREVANKLKGLGITDTVWNEFLE